MGKGNYQLQISSRKKREVKRRLLDSYNWKCAYCLKDLNWETATLDHIIPKSKGGNDYIKNLCIACNECNQLYYDEIKERPKPVRKKKRRLPKRQYKNKKRRSVRQKRKSEEKSFNFDEEESRRE